MKERVSFVNRHTRGPVVDVGIGSGAFVSLRNQDMFTATTLGYDVNPVAVNWLIKNNRWWDINNQQLLPSICFWDVLEHIPDFRSIIARVSNFVFVSIPIFDDAEHVLKSKHFRKDEHIWYFTADGLVWMFNQMGFELVEENRAEEAIGREDIGCYAFKRRS